MTTTTGGIAGFPAKGFGVKGKNIKLADQAKAIKSQPVVKEKSHARTGCGLRNCRGRTNR